MPTKKHNPKDLFPQYNNYSHAVEVSGESRILFISGLNGYMPDGIAILESADMGYENSVSLRTYLAGPEFDEPNIALRTEFLGGNEPASTVVCCQLLESKWKLEIEAVAAT